MIVIVFISMVTVSIAMGFSPVAGQGAKGYHKLNTIKRSDSDQF